MKRFEEFGRIDNADFIAMMIFAAKTENVVCTGVDLLTQRWASFAVSYVKSDGNTAEIPFSIDLTTVSEFVKMFPVACFNAKCVDARMKQC